MERLFQDGERDEDLVREIGELTVRSNRVDARVFNEHFQLVTFATDHPKDRVGQLLTVFNKSNNAKLASQQLSVVLQRWSHKDVVHRLEQWRENSKYSQSHKGYTSLIDGSTEDPAYLLTLVDLLGRHADRRTIEVCDRWVRDAMKRQGESRVMFLLEHKTRPNCYTILAMAMHVTGQTVHVHKLSWYLAVMNTDLRGLAIMAEDAGKETA